MAYENPPTIKEALEIKADNLPEVMTGREVAAFFRTTQQSIKRWCKNKDIPYFVINKRGDRRFKRKDILAIYNNEK
jgi:hypothetical protein